MILVGESALALLGSPRLTIDIDFIGDDVHPNPLHRTLMQITRETQIHVEPVPLERFVPLPELTYLRLLHAYVESDKFHFHLPLVDEQCRIADLLWEADNAITVE